MTHNKTTGIRNLQTDSRNKNNCYFYPHLGSTDAEWFTLDNPLPHIVNKYIYKQIITTSNIHIRAHSHRTNAKAKIFFDLCR